MFPDGRVREPIRFGVVFAAYVGDGEIEGVGELTADPVQGIETRAAAGVFAFHLADYYFGIGVDV